MVVGVAFLWLTGLNEVDYTHYPGRELQLQWLRSYLEAYKEYKSQGTQVSNTEVELLYVQVNRFALVSWNWIYPPPSGIVTRFDPSAPCQTEHHAFVFFNWITFFNAFYKANWNTVSGLTI